MTDTMYCCVCRGNIADFYHAIHVHAMAYSLLLAYRHFSSLLSSVFLLSQNWFKKDLTIESLSIIPFLSQEARRYQSILFADGKTGKATNDAMPPKVRVVAPDGKRVARTFTPWQWFT